MVGIGRVVVKKITVAMLLALSLSACVTNAGINNNPFRSGDIYYQGAGIGVDANRTGAIHRISGGELHW
tara:strand:- start:104 stop:310 length:207 start_codon:yes stop_codon:yes gene_type:complete